MTLRGSSARITSLHEGLHMSLGALCNAYSRCNRQQSSKSGESCADRSHVRDRYLELAISIPGCCWMCCCFAFDWCDEKSGKHGVGSMVPFQCVQRYPPPSSQCESWRMEHTNENSTVRPIEDELEFPTHARNEKTWAEQRQLTSVIGHDPFYMFWLPRLQPYLYFSVISLN